MDLKGYTRTSEWNDANISNVRLQTLLGPWVHTFEGNLPEKRETISEC